MINPLNDSNMSKDKALSRDTGTSHPVSVANMSKDKPFRSFHGACLTLLSQSFCPCPCITYKKGANKCAKAQECSVMVTLAGKIPCNRKKKKHRNICRGQNQERRQISWFYSELLPRCHQARQINRPPE